MQFIFYFLLTIYFESARKFIWKRSIIWFDRLMDRYFTQGLLELWGLPDDVWRIDETKENCEIVWLYEFERFSRCINSAVSWIVFRKRWFIIVFKFIIMNHKTYSCAEVSRTRPSALQGWANYSKKAINRKLNLELKFN